MTLAALSSAPLLDRDKGAAVSKTELHEIIKRTGFEAVSLDIHEVQPEHWSRHLPRKC